MPQHRKVPSLYTLSLTNVGFKIERMAYKIATKKEVLAYEYIQQTRDFIHKLMTSVPHYLHDHIAIEVLKAVRRVVLQKCLTFKRKEMLGRINEAVLIPQLKCLNVSVFPRKVTRHFYPNMQNLTGLQKLEISYYPNEMRTEEVFHNYLSESISAMKKLESFTCKNICTDAIVQAIGYHCRDIQYLDLGRSYSVTDQSIPYLIQCINLKILKISRTSITSDGMTQIIIGLPNLLEVDYDQFDSVIKCLKNSSCGPFELRKAQSYYILKEDLNFFLDTFPKIEHMEFNQPLYDFPMSVSLDNLKTLVVRMYGIYDNFFKELLKVKGGTITSIFFDCAEGVNIQHIIAMGQYCPNLTSLKVRTCGFIDSYIPSGRFVEPLFKNLRKVTWTGDGGSKHLEFVLSHALSIQVISVSFSTEITHGLVEYVLSRNPMSDLEVFSVLSGSDLSMRTVEMLLESCPNLRVLSRLDKWGRIQKDELKTFKEYISSHNIDMKYDYVERPMSIS